MTGIESLIKASHRSLRAGKAAADRLVWTVEIMSINAADRVLEIGCGHGVAVTLVCAKLTTGTILAIDRSATMIEMATRRNAGHIAAGTATFQAVALHEAILPDGHFDKIFGIHTPVFLRGDPGRELEIIRRALAPGGQLFLSYQPLHTSEVEPAVERLSTTLTRHGFAPTARVKDLPSGRTLCVIARSRPDPER